MSSTTILVVEDETIVGMGIRKALKDMGYDVPAVISSGEKAIAKAQIITPDLVIMDISLKGKYDGVEAAKQIQDAFHIPIVYLTAHSDIKTLQRVKQTKPFGYVVKPFEERDLQTTIEIALSRYQAEKEVRQALEKEREINQLKHRFLSMTSHDLRTPLSVVSLAAELLESFSSTWEEEKKLRYIHKIQQAVRQMDNLLEDILIIGKAEVGSLGFNPNHLNLVEFCQELVDELQLIFQTRSPINLVFKNSCQEAYMDAKLLRQILTNLLSNAIKYSPNNQPINFYLSCDHNFAVFCIQDQGIGIPPQDLQELFKSFRRASNVGEIPGTGLGLAIVKKLTEIHRGTISVESELQEGTTFTVSLPFGKA
ncbi:MAG: ATP-binding protein [Spirulinaceae cyanobacterium]